jgi:hypothetical protein
MQFDKYDWRDFVTLLGGAAAWPLGGARAAGASECCASAC